MNAKSETKKQNTILWWVGWIALTIGSFFVACWFWTWFIAAYVGSVKSERVTLLWVAAVFGTWMVFLLPLIILMYNKVDKAYEDARIKREALEFKRKEMEGRREAGAVRFQHVEASRRMLAEALRKKIGKFPDTIKGGHLVTAILKDGRRFEHVFIAGKKEVLGIYGAEQLPFDIQEITDLEPSDLDHMPVFKPELWLRLDGGEA